MQAVLKKIAQYYPFTADRFVCLGGFNQHVFKNNSYVLKVFREDQASIEQLEHEVNVTAFMNRAGVPSAKIVQSFNGREIEHILYRGVHYFCFVQTHIAGDSIPITDLKSTQVYQWGASIGALHETGKLYPHKAKVQHWHEESLLSVAEGLLEEPLQSNWRNLYNQLSALSTNHQCYGLIHHDFHHENIRFSKNKLYILDYESAIHHWYIYDLAIPIYHAALFIEKDKRCQWYESFSTMLLEGYASKTTLQKKWVDKLPYFVYYRQWYSYLYFEKHLEKNEQVTQMLEKMKSYLAAEKTII
ncbi:MULTISPECIES: phosphotransferase enzyme family protein [Shouchella]|nr:MULTISPECIES: phosphotransferase [Shouchella]KQL58420.1 hypothetical protein AN965_03795 [Alkalicoccobacillus plakortidis]MBG9782831.1 hypothetical protein [Shouchella lehensis]